MIHQFTSFDALLSYFGSSLFFLGLLSCLIPGFFRLGVIVMLVADIPLVLTILFPSVLHGITDALEISNIFTDDFAHILGLIAGVVSFFVVFSLYYWFLKRHKHASGKDSEKAASSHDNTAIKKNEVAETSSKKNRGGAGSMRTRRSLMLSDDERIVSNQRLASLTEGMQPLDSNFGLGGYAQTNTGMTGLSEEQLMASDLESSKVISNSKFTLEGLTASADSEGQDFVLPENKQINPRAIGRVDDLLRAMDNGDLTMSPVTVESEPKSSFAEVLTTAQTEVTEPVEVNLIHSQASASGREDQDSEKEEVERATEVAETLAPEVPISTVIEEEPLLQEESKPVPSQEQEKKQGNSAVHEHPESVPSSVIESVQAALTKLEAVAPTLDAKSVAEEKRKVQQKELEHLGLSFTVSTSNKSGIGNDETSDFVDRCSYAETTKYVGAFHEKELSSLLNNNEEKALQESDKAVELPTQGNDLVQSLQNHLSTAKDSLEALSNAAQQPLDKSAQVAQALARLSSEAHAIAVAIDQATVSHGIDQPKEESQEQPVLLKEPSCPPQIVVPSEQGSINLTSDAHLNDVGQLSLKPDAALSLVTIVNAAEPSLEIEPVVKSLSSDVISGVSLNAPLVLEQQQAGEITPVSALASVAPSPETQPKLQNQVSTPAPKSESIVHPSKIVVDSVVQVSEPAIEDQIEQDQTQALLQHQHNEVELPYQVPQRSLVEAEMKPKLKAIRSAIKHKQEMAQATAALEKVKRQRLQESMAKYAVVKKAQEYQEVQPLVQQAPIAEPPVRQPISEQEARNQVASLSVEGYVRDQAKAALHAKASGHRVKDSQAMVAAKRRFVAKIAAEQQAKTEAMNKAQTLARPHAIEKKVVASVTPKAVRVHSQQVKAQPQLREEKKVVQAPRVAPAISVKAVTTSTRKEEQQPQRPVASLKANHSLKRRGIAQAKTKIEPPTQKAESKLSVESPTTSAVASTVKTLKHRRLLSRSALEAKKENPR